MIRKTDRSSGTGAAPRDESRARRGSPAALRPEAIDSALTSNLPALKALISNHRTLLADARRRNHLLEIENTRMERELGVRPGIERPTEAPRECSAAAECSDRARLVWVQGYLNGTLAQTLWALNGRAEQLAEHVTSPTQQEQTYRLLEMTHTAYEQLRDLMSWLQRNTDE